MQETFLRALSNAMTLSGLPDYKQRAWFFKVLKNILVDKRRKGRFEVLLNEQSFPEVPFYDATAVEIEDLLNALPFKYREVVVKRYLLGMTSKQIAAYLSVPEATVRYRLHVAINRLRSQMNISGGHING